MAISAITTSSHGMWGNPGVSAPRIPSETYTSGLTSTAYLINGTGVSHCHG